MNAIPFAWKSQIMSGICQTNVARELYRSYNGETVLHPHVNTAHVIIIDTE